ncbi:MAG: uncharacterized protein KVP18_001398 [Porospora cf. gigantea A]|uniref:uncharacterized protein n=1 Tax=Porospora cf. gigantea A TaxID=2853593 RepID=UPI00355A04A5|nr:MAG: hypothetical protein KVP18_001398 [Porospora cf. gigantea A]
MTSFNRHHEPKSARVSRPLETFIYKADAHQVIVENLHGKRYGFDFTTVGVSRHTLLAVYLLSTCLAGPLTFNWPPFRRLFAFRQVFYHLCDPDDVLYSDGTCLAQQNALASLPTSAAMGGFLFAFPAGVIKDRWGPKTSCLVGLVFKLISYVMLALSSPSFDGYTLGFLSAAIGDQPFFLGMLDAVHLFPGYEGLVIASFGMARTLVYYFANLTVFMCVTVGFPYKLTMLGLFFVHVFVMVLMLFFIPSAPFNPATLAQRRFAESPDACVRLLPALLWDKSFWRAATTIPFILWNIYFAILVMQVNFFSVSLDLQISPAAFQFYTQATFVEALACWFVGGIADWRGLWMCPITITVSMACAYVGICISWTSADYILTLFAVVARSLYLAQTHLVFYKLFPQGMLGRLIGLTFCVNGLIGLSHGPIFDAANSHGRLTVVDIVYASISAMNLSILLYLAYSVPRPGRSCKRIFTRRIESAVSQTQTTQTTTKCDEPPETLPLTNDLDLA